MWAVQKYKKTFIEGHKKSLIKLCDDGIPDSVRGSVWKILSDVSDLAKDKELSIERLLKPQEEGGEGGEEEINHSRACIMKDSFRILPDHSFFQEKGRESLRSVLEAFAVRFPEIGYTSGMGFVAGLLLLYMESNVSFNPFLRRSSITNRCDQKDQNSDFDFNNRTRS